MTKGRGAIYALDAPEKSMLGTERNAVVLFAHGARDERWAEPFHRVLAAVRAAAPELAVELAFLELMTPDLESAVQRLAGSVASRAGTWQRGARVWHGFGRAAGDGSSHTHERSRDDRNGNPTTAG